MIDGFQNISDEELVKACKNGDEKAYGALIGRYIFAVRSRAYAYDKSVIDFEDLIQEGFIGLMNAVKCYDESFGTWFSTFAYLCIDRNILTAVKKTLSKKQIPKSALIFIEENTDFETDKSQNPENVIISKENINYLKQKISENLSEKERSVLNMYLSGKSYRQIADSLKISEKAVDNAIQRLRKKLK